ncbi:MAG: hypothetical protein C0402_05000 [Thermodesulfovibrio sp.]|nr:hypothetical protein [Thermodesulfovibrio sp.]
MIKKIVLILIVAASLFACGGGNSTSDTPTGVNPGVVSRVELMATSYVNQTNGYCYLKTKAIDGNGLPIVNRQVVWTNLSTTGVLDHTTSMTNESGIATATLYSTTAGFATVQAEVNADNTGTEKIRDKKTVYFTPFDMAWPTPPTTGTTNLSSIALDVDSGNPRNNIYNEPTDFIMLDAAGKTDADIRATVTARDGSPLLNSAVTFSADSVEVTFPLAGVGAKTAIVHTNSLGIAATTARVSPEILRNSESTVNITASAVIDSATTLPAVVTLFLKPVTIASVTVTANPTTVASGGTSEITATVTTSAGTPPPSGTTVTFTSIGSTTFSQTDDFGRATTTFTAPTVGVVTTITVTASAGGRSGSRNITVTPVAAPLTVTPVSGTVTGLANPDANPTDDLTFFVAGGIGPYSVTSSNPGVITSPGSLGATGTQFTVDPNAVAATTIVTLRVSDSTGAFVNALVTVNPLALTMIFDKINVIGQATSANGPSNLVTVTVTGGTGPYVVSSDSPALTPPGLWSFAATPFSFTFYANNVGATTTVTLTAADNTGATVNRTLTIFPQTTTTGLTISVNKTSVIGLTNPDGNTTDDVTFSVIGGTPPYVISAGNGTGCNNAFVSPVGPWNLAVSGNTVVLDPKSVSSVSLTTPQVCTLTVVDNVGLTATTTFTVLP